MEIYREIIEIIKYMLHYFIVLNTMKSHLLECVVMQNYEVEVKNHSEVTEVQELFFAMGCRKGVCVDSRYPKLIVTHNNNDGWYSAGAMIGHNNKYKKITLQELRDMVAPKQKEYLVKTNTGYTLQVLSDVVDGHGGIIEVPEGAVALVTYDKNAGYWFNKENKFKGFGRVSNIGDFGKIDTLDHDSYLDYSNAIGGCVTWQRESLNDQVASAEQARQEQAQTREISECDLIDSGKLIIGGLGESFPVGLGHHSFTQPEELPFVGDNAWNKQVGGDHYKKLAIQPMEYALQNKLDYAQANVVKYVTRHADKNGKQDLLKAIHNIELMIAHYYPDQE